MEEGLKLGLESNYKHDPEKGTLTVRKIIYKHRGITSGNMAHCEVPHKRDGPRAPTAIHGPSGPKFQPEHKANAIADCLEKQFTTHKLCNEIHEWQVEATDQALLVAVINDPAEKVRPCDL
jgi:hypothetical protein